MKVKPGPRSPPIPLSPSPSMVPGCCWRHCAEASSSAPTAARPCTPSTRDSATAASPPGKGASALLVSEDGSLLAGTSLGLFSQNRPRALGAHKIRRPPRSIDGIFGLRKNRDGGRRARLHQRRFRPPMERLRRSPRGNGMVQPKPEPAIPPTPIVINAGNVSGAHDV